METPWKIIIKVLFIFILFFYSVYALLYNDGNMYIDALNLAFHEAGHLMFFLMGDFLQFLGGTILQLLIPFGIALYALYLRKLYSFSIFLFWTGQNLFGISTYIKDARAQQLPLIGGGIHDWHYILGRLDWLSYDQKIGNTVYLTGWVLITLAAILGTYFAIRNEE